MTEASGSLALRSQQKVRFDQKDMDYYFSWILGRSAFGASDASECYSAAEQIPDSDVDAWHRAWRSLAGRVEALGYTALEQGNTEEARLAFLRACTYYRAPLFIMDPREPEWGESWGKMRSCFRRSTELDRWPIESVSIAYAGKSLPGYFASPHSGKIKRPTLIIVGGIETFAEDCFLMIGPAALERGYNVLAADLPGQGMTPRDGLFLQARSDRGVKAVVDFALSRPETDPDRLALFGFSWGGHIALKGAEKDRRIKAAIANPATNNIFASALAQQSKGGRSDPILFLIMEQLAWRWGVSLTNVPQRMARAVEFLLYARADCRKIRCPVLCMAGESEAKVTLDQTRQSYRLLPHPGTKLAILTRNEGSAAHCQVDNLALLSRTILDWLAQLWRLA